MGTTTANSGYRCAVVGIAEDEPEPDFADRCPVCGRWLPPVVLLVGVDADAL